ncbi:hypothetical protein ABL78_7374 [Leptomonas seymouri]|uniref:Uncharacterized protein n=1 Tax=Leptomonas seymouri TaxID=5684 RepID=A0A0N0P3E9_LEPSE|nr:hypothetical protein ABL78_7374 [Leptomonas seymouri]|eukprot:KPI83587.1 hypothetical protein ABL78_7374 [Leptomonas seymouri]
MEASMDELRLEPLTFVGYQRQRVGQPGEAPHTCALIDFVTPHGAHVLLHPSSTLCPPQSKPPLPTPSLPQQQKQQCSPPHSPLGGAGSSKQPPSHPPSYDTCSNAKGATQPRSAGTAAGEEQDELLRVLTTASAPPDTFQVEFVLSSSSSSSSSSSRLSATSSRSASPTSVRDALIPADGDGRTLDLTKSLEETKDAQGAAPPALSDDAEKAVEAVLESMTSSDALLPPKYDHGIELSVRAGCYAELGDLLTRCALKLFDGRLPLQQQPPQPPTEPGHQSGNLTDVPPSPQQPQVWSEAVNYHRVLLMGYDNAGAVCLMAQPFAQAVPPPQSWRLCPLPLLLCSTTQLTRLYKETQQDEGGADTQRGGEAAAAARQRFPVLSRLSSRSGAGASRSSHTASPPLSTSNSPPRGMPPLIPPPPPPPGPRPPAATTALASSSPLSNSPNVYLSPPLRWRYAAIGHTPALDLSQLFQVVPSRVYQLTQPPEKVVFIGVACGVPWVREVVVHRKDDVVAAAAALPGYLWKDPHGFAVPLVCCHDARDLRVRHGLVDETPPPTAPAPALAAAAAGAATVSFEQRPEEILAGGPEAPSGEPLQQQASETPPLRTSPPLAAAPSHPHGEAKEGKSEEGEQPHRAEEGGSPKTQPADVAQPMPPRLPPPAHTAAASVTPSTPPAKLYVEKGTMVFVPGRFGVMLGCVAKPATLEALFGVVHGDRLVPRATTSPSSPLSGGLGVPPPEKKELGASGSSPSAAAAAVVTVMGVYNRNVLVVLADGENQATQIPIRRGVTEVAELFRKVAGTPLPPPALQIESISSTLPLQSNEKQALGAVPAPASAAGAGAANQDSCRSSVATRDDVAEAPAHPEQTAIFVEETVLAKHNDRAKDSCHATGAAAVATLSHHDAIAAGLMSPDTAEGDPDKASPFEGHVEEEDEGLGCPMPPAPPTNAQDSPMRVLCPLGGDEVQRWKLSQPADKASSSRSKEVQLAEEEEPQPTAVGPLSNEAATQPSVTAVARQATEETAEGVMEDGSGEGRLSPTTFPLAPADEVTITPASATPTTAVPPADALPAATHSNPAGITVEQMPRTEERHAEGAVMVVDGDLVALGLEQANGCDDNNQADAHPSAPSARKANHYADSSAVLVQSAHQGDEQEPRLPSMGGSSLSTLHVEDAHECSGSAQVLSSDHTPSILPTPSASLTRHLQFECDQEDERAPGIVLHRAGGMPDELGETNHLNGTRAAPTGGGGAPQVARLLLPSGAATTGHAHPHVSHQPTDDSESSNTATTVMTAHETSAARSSESPAAMIPEAYYAELSAAAAEPSHRLGGSGDLHGADRHVQRVASPPAIVPSLSHAPTTPPATQATETLHDVFSPSHSPPAEPADGHTVPRYCVPPSAARSYDSSEKSAPWPGEASAGSRLLSVTTRSTTAASATFTPTPFTNFMKAFAIYSLREPSGCHASDSAGLLTHSLPGRSGEGVTGRSQAPPPGLPPILNFYRAQPIVRVLAATEGQLRCRAAWCGGVGNAAVQDFKRGASTAVFEDLCVDELITLLSLV